MPIQLTEGCIADILQGHLVENPVVQLISHKKICSTNSCDRYRVIISDGKWFNSYAMLATQLNDMITNNELPDFTVVRMNNYVPSDLPNNKAAKRKIIVILDLTVLHDGKTVGAKLGEPKMYDESTSSTNCTPMDTSPSKSTTSGFNGNSNQGSTSSTSYTPMDISPNKSSASGFHGNSNQGMQNGINNSLPVAPIQNHVANNANAPPGMGPILPIIALNPFQNRWTIKGRVTSKSTIRTWSNLRGDGKLFSVDLADQSGAIRATAFNAAVDRFHDTLELNRIFYFSRCTVKPANKRFSSLPHDFELSINADSQVFPAPDDDSSIPQIQYNFTPLGALKDLQPDSIVDIIGVCKSAGEVQNLVARTTRRELKKRDLLLVDQTDASVTFTLWDTQAEEFDASTNPVIAVKGARITEFNGGKSVGMSMNGNMQLNPDIEKSHRLRGWFDSLSDNHEFNNISRAVGDSAGSKMYLLKEINTHNLGMRDKADYFGSEAAVMFIPHDRAIYQSCPNPDCKKKIIDQNDGTYRCEKCNQNYSSFLYRLILNIQICDWTGSQWLSLFQEQAETLLGATAKEIGESRERYDDSFESYFRKPLFKYFSFRVRAKLDTFNGENRLRMTAVALKPIDFKEANKRLLNEIKRLSGVSLSSTQA